MMLRRLIVAGAVLLAVPAAADDCTQATSQAALNACAGTNLARADGELNATYKTVFARLSPAGQTRLRDAQRAWVAFRDQECAFESSGPDGGSVAPMVAVQCALRLTEGRTRALAAFQRCAEGDVSCPR